ncbi:MAG: pyridoxal-dependent decarboxylase, exosortase A system-associated [Burkholderiaceae bacterium]|nr:pyridoxal-dependent decarboxylase, exosortase A system-associated [Burkholderiaceae bacterium]
MRLVEFPLHASLEGFDVVDEELVIGGIGLRRLAERVGATPFYAYSRSILEARARALRAQLPAGVHLHYAIKANPMPAVVQLLSQFTDGLDVASGREMRVALDTGVSPSLISFAGPGKSEAEISQAVAAGVTLNLESERQLDQALAAGHRLGVAPQLALRVNPSFELKGSGMKMGGGAKPFGIDEARIPALAARIEADGLALVGFHIYSGSQNLNAAALIEAQRLTVELGLKLAGSLRSGVRWINIGGGFGVPYFPGDKPLDTSVVLDALAPMAQAARASADAHLVIELGRYLVAPAGVYVCRVIDRKVSEGQVFLVVDGGLHHHLAASGNFGQVIRKNYPVAIGTAMGRAQCAVQSVVGPLCTPLDLLGDRMSLPLADVGDLVVVFQSGAYGPSASPTRFLSHPEPLEVLV